MLHQLDDFNCQYVQRLMNKFINESTPESSGCQKMGYFG